MFGLLTVYYMAFFIRLFHQVAVLLLPFYMDFYQFLARRLAYRNVRRHVNIVRRRLDR